MTKPFTKTTMLSSYKDDYADSSSFYQILFNSGRALQARELTQLQTISSRELGRLGRHLFKEGAAVNPGGMTLNTGYEFVKLSSASVLPADTSVLVDTTFVGQTSSVEVVVLEVVEAEDSDPATLYVRYTSTSSVTSGTAPIRLSPGETISNGTYSLTVQSQNTTSNPAVGTGCRVSIADGDFFTQGRFVFARSQSKVVSKYDPAPTLDVGFRVVQEVVTVADDTSLYDNQGAVPNITAPGADRYRISLELATRDELDSDENFVYVARILDGTVVDEVRGIEDYNKINDLLALRTKEESGNYVVSPFIVKFDNNDSDDTVLDAKVSDGIAYINGYRAAVPYPTRIQVSKARDTVLVENEVVAANYGNYVIGTGGSGARDVDTFGLVNLRSATNYGGSTIGTARVYAVEEDGTNFRYYLFDVKMNSGQSFRNVKSAGESASSYFNVVLEGGKAALKDATGTSLLFPLPKTRPSSITDISLTVQRRFETTTDASGEGTISLTAPGETFADTNSWFFSNDDSAYTTEATATGAGTTTATISDGPPSATALEVLAYVNKSAGVSRTKTLTETTVTDSADSDGSVSLGVADVYSIVSVKAGDSDGPDISSRFTLDDGQRDTHYDTGKLVLKGGQSAPTGPVFVRLKYFAHGVSGDFFSVNSYSGQVSYEDIPSYRQNNGVVVSLRDVLDFRSTKNSSGTFSGSTARVNELPKNTSLVTLDVVYYQPRFSKLVIDTSGRLSFISGPSSLTPILPPTPSDALHLYNVKMNAFTLDGKDLVLEKIENRRYTMADIARLEGRVDKLEELTTLSLLELETANLDVLDSSGANRTKAGFLVDNFKDQFFADLDNTEYAAAIDPVDKVLRPSFSSSTVRLEFDSDQASGTVRKGDNVYLSYSSTPYISQTIATGTENVNPFAVITNEGTITISPASDVWVDTERLPDHVVDNPSSPSPISTNWNEWTWGWVGTSSGNAVNSPNGVTQTLGDRVVSSKSVPWMRSVKVHFRAQGLKPDTQHFAYFDGVPVADWVREETYSLASDDDVDYGNRHSRATEHPAGSSTLTSDTTGKIEGTFFVPDTDALKFRAGTREFTLLDVTAYNPDAATSLAQAAFTSKGTIETHQASVRATRPTVSRSGSDRAEVDPLAQSFFVSETSGLYATKVDLYFATKDSTVPVQVQLRPMVNGSPSSTVVIPGSVKYLDPASVNVSDDASASTTFEFDEPVFLSPLTDYAVVVLAESTKYTVYVAEIGAFLLGSTEKKVTRQPTTGSLFKSQNSSTWEPDQTKDLMFVLSRASFVSSGTAILENITVPDRLLGRDPFTTDSGSSTVTVSHPSHGMLVNDTVEFTLDSSLDVNGIAGTSILGERTVTTVDETGYTFEADSDATSSGLSGGTDVVASQNLPFELVVPILETLTPNNTTLALAGKFTTGRSLAGSETPYSKSTSWKDLYVKENNTFSAPQMVAGRVMEPDLGTGVRSATIRVSMSTTDPAVSPMVDLQRSSLLLVHNVVDDQDSASTNGHNFPLSFVAETDPAHGSSVAKHVAVPVTLEEDAVGLKILLGANRPSTADIRVFYRVAPSSGTLSAVNWVEAPLDRPVPADENTSVFRDYEYLAGGPGGSLAPFSQFQVKIVFASTNTARVPVVRDLRVIALGV